MGRLRALRGHGASVRGHLPHPAARFHPAEADRFRHGPGLHRPCRRRGRQLGGPVYFVIPNRRQEWGKVWPGALVAGIAFELVTLIFPLYLTVNKGINQYGATFGLMFLLMTFFYFIGLIAMLGVEFNAVLFPVPVEQPSRRGEPGRTAVSAPPQSGPEGEGLAWSPKPSPKQVQPAAARRAPANQDLPARVPAFLIFLGSAVAGLLVGRRAAGGAD
ncbi:MAG: YihY/virulence factor BrkB family protein [Chloroflexi bacterium]|nr:MAG: YihY/virulence factor BrkB family protein [Chloroflexota bacterium]